MSNFVPNLSSAANARLLRQSYLSATDRNVTGPLQRYHISIRSLRPFSGRSGASSRSFTFVKIPSVKSAAHRLIHIRHEALAASARTEQNDGIRITAGVRNIDDVERIGGELGRRTTIRRRR